MIFTFALFGLVVWKALCSNSLVEWWSGGLVVWWSGGLESSM